MSHQTAAPTRISNYVVPKKTIHPIAVMSMEHFRPIVKLIQSKVDTGVEWVMDMPTNEFRHKLYVTDEKTVDLKVSLLREWTDKTGKPVMNPKTNQPMTSIRRFLSAPFILHAKSKVNGLGDIDDEPPFGEQKKSRETRKVMTTNHPFAELVKEPGKEKYNAWLKHQYKVASSFRQAVAEMFIDNSDLSIGPDKIDGKTSELKIALDEARALAKTDRPGAIQRLMRRFHQIVKIPNETEWNPVERKKTKTGNKKDQDEAYMIFKSGMVFPKKEDYERPKNEPEEHPDPAVRDYLTALNTPDPKTKKLKLKVEQVYQYPKIYIYSAARSMWVQMEPVDAELPDFNEDEWVVMASFNMSATMAPFEMLAFPCYWDKLFYIGKSLIPVPKMGPREAVLDLETIEDAKIREDLRRMQEEAQAEERSLVVQTDLKRMQEDAQAAEEESALALKRAKQVIELQEGTDDF